ncbi:hypothetical protein U3516DRAFT_760878 [Neocallimastix sp. 'constans']
MMKKEDKGESLIKGSKMNKSYDIVFSLNFGYSKKNYKESQLSINDKQFNLKRYNH